MIGRLWDFIFEELNVFGNWICVCGALLVFSIIFRGQPLTAQGSTALWLAGLLSKRAKRMHTHTFTCTFICTLTRTFWQQPGQSEGSWPLSGQRLTAKMKRSTIHSYDVEFRPEMSHLRSLLSPGMYFHPTRHIYTLGCPLPVSKSYNSAITM